VIYFTSIYVIAEFVIEISKLVLEKVFKIVKDRKAKIIAKIKGDIEQEPHHQAKQVGTNYEDRELLEKLVYK
jgi:hypothetical protein